MGTRQLVSATANPHKLAEISIMLAGLADISPRPDNVPDVDENADTLAGNAELKVAAITAATGKPAIADDTGLEVDALGGAPGVRSARYAGDDADDTANVAHLLDELGSVGAHRSESRRARFRTVMVVGWPDGRRVLATGTVDGHITDAPRGSGGFGYDPVFVPDDGDGRTFAEMTPDEKNRISHRSRALAALVGQLGSDTDQSGL